jgi:hypothetical protein
MRALMGLSLAGFLVSFLLFLGVSEKGEFYMASTMLHESNHAVSAIITGGEVSRILLKEDGSGYTYSQGANLAILLPAGYLGSSLISATMFYSINRFYYGGQILFFVVGIILTTTTLLWGRGDRALMVGITSSIVLIGISFLGGSAQSMIRRISYLALANAVAFYYGITNFWSLGYLMTTFVEESDAFLFSTLVMPNISYFWVLRIWIAVSLALWILATSEVARFYWELWRVGE